MGGSQKQLKDRLKGVIDAFNTNIVDNVMPYLDDSANVFRIKDHAPHPGKLSSKTFLQQSFRDHPKFSLLTENIVPPHDDITNATITGLANWTDTNNRPNAPDTLNYEFDCVYKDDTWFFTHVSATVLSPALSESFTKLKG
jgi:phosphatidylserine/phosphatidylglycerophosphate/cardiolipin synthase-like enzyme